MLGTISGSVTTNVNKMSRVSDVTGRREKIQHAEKTGGGKTQLRPGLESPRGAEAIPALPETNVWLSHCRKLIVPES